MDRRKKNRNPIAVISGAGSGIGKSLAQLFSKGGYEIFLIGKTEKKLKSVAQSLENESKIFVCDLSEKRQIKDLKREISNAISENIQVLINNAGIFKPAYFKYSTDDEWEEHFQTNLMGALRLTRICSPYFSAQNSKNHIVNIASSVVNRPVIGTSSYSASKAALVEWSRILALELAPIRVNCVCPGIINTPMHNFSKEQVKDLAPKHPLNRIGEPVEVASLIYWLVTESNWITGTSITIDGGLSIT